MTRALLVIVVLAAGCGERTVELLDGGGMDAGPSDASVDLSDRDPERCGTEGEDCEDFEYCVAGECVCRPGLTRVIERCVDTMADEMHCGAPDTPCAGVCNAGSCEATCPAGTMVCLGGCADVSNDPLHCGECERKCGSGELCIGGECRVFRPAPCTSCPCGCGDRTCCTYPTRPQDVICIDGEICPAP